ncbi:hypothetical protein VTJ83DRAFT_2385 [Remersonia thermophila]|uniref:Uncharacterized protein n=1 Tax=Remersonia thermophila TaxID=72144 RepID=A0ABR4DK30_9PEZI
MNRHALRCALGRAAPSLARRAALGTPLSTATPTSFFSTTAPALADGDAPSTGGTPSPARSRSRSAVEKITQLNSKRNGASPDGPFKSSNPGAGPRVIDARALKVSPGGAAGPSSGSGPKVLNLRSLRGRGGGAGGGGSTGLRRRAPFGADGGPLLGRTPERFGARPGPRAGGRPGTGAGAARGRGGSRLGARGALAAAGGRGGARRARGGTRRAGGARRGRGDKDEGSKAGQQGSKLTWTPEEQAVIDRLEKGEVVRFDPALPTADKLAGYGSPLATDAPQGRVETVMRAMRVMTGGMAFNPESGVTADVREVVKRYREKKPVFVHSQAEKEWIEWAKPKYRLVGPSEDVKKAILNTVVSGKYQPTSGFADLSDAKAAPAAKLTPAVKNIMAAQLSRTGTYTANDSKRFIDKVLSLLPAQAAGEAAAPRAPPKP